MIELISFGGKKEQCDFSDEGILLANLGPMLVKYLQKRLVYFLWITNFMRICPKYGW